MPDGSFLAGTNVLLPRGWIQFNVARFSPGDFPAMNDPLHDRESAFVAAEYDVWSSVRVFGGVDAIKTNIDPDLDHCAVVGDLPRSTGTRAFGGVQFRLGGPSMLTIRIEEGDRVAQAGATSAASTESDTGVRSAEWQSLVRPLHRLRALCAAAARRQLGPRLGVHAGRRGGSALRETVARGAGVRHWRRDALHHDGG